MDEGNHPPWRGGWQPPPPGEKGLCNSFWEWRSQGGGCDSLSLFLSLSLSLSLSKGGIGPSLVQKGGVVPPLSLSLFVKGGVGSPLSLSLSLPLSLRGGTIKMTTPSFAEEEGNQPPWRGGGQPPFVDEDGAHVGATIPLGAGGGLGHISFLSLSLSLEREE